MKGVFFGGERTVGISPLMRRGEGDAIRGETLKGGGREIPGTPGGEKQKRERSRITGKGKSVREIGERLSNLVRWGEAQRSGVSQIE